VVRLVIARCTVDYEGRLSAHLPEAVRLIMVKADGCVAVHADGGAYKPLNWMNAPNTLLELEHRWEVTNSKGERLIIDLNEVISDQQFGLGLDPGLQKDGVEAHLQELLADKPWVLEEGLVLLRREYPTDLGPVDLMCTDINGTLVAIEVKRRGEIDGVEQLARYVERLILDGRFGPIRAMFVAQSITPQARILAMSRNIETLEVDYDGLREIESSTLRLF
jgi:RecB family endonuclease NucS